MSAMKEQPVTEERQPPPNELQRGKADKEVLLTLTLGQNPSEEFYSILMKEFREMKGSTDEKIKRLFNRLQKFFLRDKGARINIKDGYFCKKRQPFYHLKGVHVLENQIMLFGVDFAKNRDIIRAYQPQDFCPVDMSHVKLIFTDFYAAMQALRRNQRQGVIENSTKLEQGIQEPSKGWMQMKPYYISNYERRVLARFATSEELQIVSTHKLESSIPQFAKRVYDLKKRESEDIEENFRLREERLQIRRLELREKREKNERMSSYQPSLVDENGENHDRANNNNFNNDNISDRSYTLNIGKGLNKSNEDDEKSSVSYRERSRDKDFDKASVRSKHSTLSMLAGLANKMNLDEKQERESIVSDASFILDQNDQNEEVFRDMAARLAGMNMGERPREQADVSYELPNNQRSFVSSASSRSYRLSENMPDRAQPEQDRSFARRGWSYSQYAEEQERIQEQKRKEEKEIVIVIDDD